jgi:hypothetical protein
MVCPVTHSWNDLGINLDEMPQADRKQYDRWLEYDPFQEFPSGPGEPWPRGIMEQTETDKTFAEIWASKPKAWQDNAIGPRRADLVRSGKVKFEDLVTKDGDLVLLKELQ